MNPIDWPLAVSLLCALAVWLYSSRRNRAIRATELAKAVDEEVTVYMSEAELWARMLLMFGTAAAALLALQMPVFGVVLSGFTGYILFLTVRELYRDWDFLRPGQRAPVLYLSAHGIHIRNDVRASWSQVRKVELKPIQLGRSRETLLVFEFEPPWRIGPPDSPAHRPGLWRAWGVPPGSFALRLSSLEGWANPNTVLMLMYMRMTPAGTASTGAASSDSSKP